MQFFDRAEALFVRDDLAADAAGVELVQLFHAVGDLLRVTAVDLDEDRDVAAVVARFEQRFRDLAERHLALIVLLEALGVREDPRDAELRADPHVLERTGTVNFHNLFPPEKYISFL